jgi:hypothetical protein
MLCRTASPGRRLSPTLLLLLFAVFAVPHAGAQSGGARIAFLHLSADAPALDVYVDGGRAVGNLNFSESSAYLGISAGAHQVQVTLASRLDVLATASLSAPAGASFTWVLSGLINAADAAPSLGSDALVGHIVQLNDNAVTGSSTSLRAVNASPGAGLLEVRVTGPTSLTVASNLGYGAVSGYAALSPGNYTVDIYQNGAPNPVESISPVMISTGNAYTIVLGGLLPGIAAVDAPNQVHGFTPVLLTDQSLQRYSPLTTGCNQVILNLPAGTAVTSILSRVLNPDAVTSIWRFDNALKLLRVGYFSDPSAPVDFTTTQASPEAAFICVRSPTTWIP